MDIPELKIPEKEREIKLSFFEKRKLKSLGRDLRKHFKKISKDDALLRDKIIASLIELQNLLTIENEDGEALTEQICKKMSTEELIKYYEEAITWLEEV